MRHLLLIAALLLSGAARADDTPPATSAPPPQIAPTLTPDLARDALTFLGRAQLTGAEAPRFMAVAEALRAIAAQPPAGAAGPAIRAP